MPRLCVRQEYITHVDPLSQLGLTSDSVAGYNIGDIHRPSVPKAAHTPELLPCGYLVGDSDTINIRLKGTAASPGPLFKRLPPSHLSDKPRRPGVSRCERHERGLAGVRHSDPEADAAALRLPAEGAPPRHPVGPQRHRKDLPGQSAVSTPAAAGGPTFDPTSCRHLQRGPQVQQGKRTIFILHFACKRGCQF